MKKVLIVLLSLLYQTSFTQNDTQKSFKNSSNKFYVGTNLAPIAVGIFGGNNFEPEYKFWYKQRLTKQNHYFRFSYSYVLLRYKNTNGFYSNSNAITPDYIEVGDSLRIRYGYYQNNNNLHSFKIGYEYQFHVGKQKNISINLGADALIGGQGSPLIFVNDTSIIEEIIEYEYGTAYLLSDESFFETTKVRGPRFFGGASPFIGFGFPIKKAFDITLEIAFDLRYINENIFNYHTNFEVNYRPTLMFSYRFDEVLRKKKKVGKN